MLFTLPAWSTAISNLLIFSSIATASFESLTLASRVAALQQKAMLKMI